MAAKPTNQKGDHHRLSTNCSQTTAAVVASSISTPARPDRRLENRNQTSSYTSFAEQNIQPPAEPEHYSQEATVNEHDEFTESLDSDEEPEVTGAESVNAEKDCKYLGSEYHRVPSNDYCNRVEYLRTGNTLPYCEVREREPDTWRPGGDFERHARIQRYREWRREKREEEREQEREEERDNRRIARRQRRQHRRRSL